MKFHNQETMHISEITLKVKDLLVMRQFYLNVFGFSILKENENSVSFSSNGKTPILNLLKVKNAIIDRRKTGLYHVAYLMPTRSDLASFVYHINNLAIRFGAGDHIVSEAIYFEDPEGNGIEVYADRDDSTWTWNESKTLVAMDTLPVDFDDLFKEPLYPYIKAPEDIVIGHVHLKVSDLEANRKFYEDYIGFNIVSKFQNNALFLSDQNYHHHIAFNIWNGTNLKNPSPENTGILSLVLKPVDKTKFGSDTAIFDPNGIEIIVE